VPNIGYREGTVERVFADPLLWPDPHTVNEIELDCYLPNRRVNSISL
jgi:hypothetical protein